MSINIKKIAATAGVISSLILGVGVVGAQDTNGGQAGGQGGRLGDMGQQMQGGLREGRGGIGRGVIREALNIVAAETGLSAQDIVSQVRDGATLSEIITANGGDVNAVIDQAVAQATERINEAVTNGNLTQERADTLLSNLEQIVTDGVNGELRPGRNEGRRGAGANVRQTLLETTASALGIDAQALRDQLSDGSTLSEVITANGGDPVAIVSSARVSITEQINSRVTEGILTQAQADEMIAVLDTTLNQAINGEPGNMGANRAFRAGVMAIASEMTGLDGQALHETLRSGVPLNEVLTANGVDVNAFINEVSVRASERLSQAVEAGRITQERADELLAQLQSELMERIDDPLPSTVPSV